MGNTPGSKLAATGGLLFALLLGCGARDSAMAVAPGAATSAAPPAIPVTVPPLVPPVPPVPPSGGGGGGGGGHCLPLEQGYLHARLRGAVNADLQWRDADMSCEGGARPDGRGIRVSIAGPLSAGRRLRLVFGIDDGAVHEVAHALPTNVTAIIEGEKQLFATLGDDKCTTDQLQRAPLQDSQAQRVEARGFCTGPASTLDGRSRLLVTTFEFSARVVLEAAK